MYVAVVLEEVQVTPGALFKIMGLAALAAFRARIEASAFRFDPEMQLVRRLIHLQALSHQFPRGLQPQAQQ